MAKRGFARSSMKGLKAFTTALSAMSRGRVDVGIFSGDNSRMASAPTKGASLISKARSKPSATIKSGMTNAQVGAKMEFGDPNPQNWIDRNGVRRHVDGIPVRSFLRQPLFIHGDKIIKDAKDDARSQLKTVAKNPLQTTKKILARVGIAAENVVQEAFNSQGDGDWEPNSPETIEAKGSASPLIDTGQLRRAISSRAVI